jgi:hypothetical protein
MEDSKSVPVGLPAAQNELLEPTGSQTQPSKPIGHKTRITSLCLRADCSACHLLSHRFLAWLILRLWRWRQHVPPKYWLTFNGLHGVISHKTELFLRILSWFRVRDYQMGFGLDDYRHSELQAITHYRWSTHFTVHRYTHTSTLVFSVFSSRILATDLTQWICFSFCGHAIAHWLTLHTRTQGAIFSASPCTAQLSTNYPLGTTKLNWLFSTEPFFITTLHAPNRKHRFQQHPYCYVFTDQLLRDGFFYCCMRCSFPHKPVYRAVA